MIFGLVAPASSLSLYSIPVVWFTALYPNLLKFRLIDRSIGYNNVQPRSNVAHATEHQNIPPQVAAKIQRMEGAHLNGNEAFPLWTSAIIVANIANLDHGFINTVALAYIATRILFNQVYINHESSSASWIRTAIFFVSVSMPMTLLVKGANKIASQ
ncbi:hypothetical protein NP233_g1759 [Leucocoprinus birnbaumii]|uniref:MAPEG family protein n=1 Tax=Leucocoprinus birnbaumii TaxID=56174 RepID=A0AAD5VZW8_9AGAR|nr:hypothetical protein NP233_g1759 [Leucocoprinus birnbaumii]